MGERQGRQPLKYLSSTHCLHPIKVVMWGGSSASAAPTPHNRLISGARQHRQ